MTRKLLGLSLAALLIGCATARFEKIDLEGLPTQEQYPDAKAVVLFKQQVLEFKSHRGDAVAEVENRVRYRSLAPDASLQAAQPVNYRKGSVDVLNVAVRGVNANTGETFTSRGKRIYTDVPVFPAAYLYSADRQLTVAEPKIATLPPGSVVEGLTEVRNRRVGEHQFLHVFGASVPTIVDRFVVKVKAGWTIEHKTFEGGKESNWEPTREEAADGGALYIWEKRDQVAVDDDDGKALSAYQPQVWVRLKSWEAGGEAQSAPATFAELSKSIFGTMEAKAEITEEVQALKNKILEGAPADKRERAARLHAFARDEVSYCAYYTSFDDGFVPHPAEKTTALRYGDCKDKANLLHTLLRAEGISSRLVTLWAHDGMPRPLVFPSLVGNSNHVALLVDLDGEAVFADPTRPSVAFGEAAPDEYGAWLLPISEKGDEPVQLPWPKAEDSLDKYRATVTVKKDGEAAVEFTRELTGAFASDTRRTLAGSVEENWKSAVKLPGGGSVEEVKVEGGAHPLHPTPLTLKGKAKWSKWSEDKKPVFYSAMDWGWRAPGAKSARREAATTNPIVLAHPYTKDYELRVKYPSASYIAGVPAKQKAESAFGTYELSYEKRGAELIVRFKLTHKAQSVDGASFADFQDWIRKADAAAVATVVVKKGGA
jgi:hypothetical protein